MCTFTCLSMRLNPDTSRLNMELNGFKKLFPFCYISLFLSLFWEDIPHVTENKLKWPQLTPTGQELADMQGWCSCLVWDCPPSWGGCSDTRHSGACEDAINYFLPRVIRNEYFQWQKVISRNFVYEKEHDTEDIHQYKSNINNQFTFL